ncbi:polyketide synthase dehydratase domain-containing protein, partial [Streptomyces sp. NPDC055287]
GRLHTRGVPVDWQAYFATSGARHVDLPTYAFQNARHWLESVAVPGDAASLGLAASAHPLFGAAVTVAGGGDTLFTSRISLTTHPWLAGHTVLDTRLFPGTGFVELAAQAGEEVGAGRVEELTLSAPLVLPERGAVQLQIVVGGADDSGRRGLEIYARPDGEADEPAWTLHASGSLIAPEEPAVGEALAVWPPAGADEVDLDDVYDRLTEQGYAYGPAFRNLRRLWKAGGELFADVALAGEQTEQTPDSGFFGLHPALLDAALHSLLPGVADETGQEGFPFAWSGVTLHAVGAQALRVRLTPTGTESFALTVADGVGAPVATIDSLALRPLSKEALREAGSPARDGLLGLRWTALPAREEPLAGEDWMVVEESSGLGEWSGSVPPVVVLPLVPGSGEPGGSGGSGGSVDVA